ncbi:P-loop containing nucleoside triphosphate hydrolase protein [Kickxella alabastrina]|uniref:P-loop containing nucleoside triphosphate hydrolase protein n=1 Tax=Kickxella alabastrina TaxID=61397 RepID=UPI0022203E06|nr:P-loop containing nucleoside triphosphate hydrolase protein [Kickxella alabastrina]KAI7835168.1 P-loop containing nucleoside triphosphate hydrolase protein [Kickxella alabastrina]KAJ1947572.1 hypothetical protein GGF37_000337 [Kickxella alabastrina]
MDDSQYDEFGNYIGPELDSSSSESEEEVEDEEGIRREEADYQAHSSPGSSDSEAEDRAHNLMTMMRRVDLAPQAQERQIVQHEDKQYYPEASAVFGADVEVLVQEEDTQALTEPIVAPIKERKFTVGNADELPATTYAKEFLVDLLGHPNLVRNVAVGGHLHHGKTALVDLLVAATHEWAEWDTALPQGTPVNRMGGSSTASGFTDTLQLERQRGVSLKTAAMALVAQDSRGKSWALNMVDTPGHADFLDEVEAGLRLADGVLLAVDAVEGVMSGTRRVIAAAMRQGLRIVLVVTKVDRLILELRLPPADAYHKLRLTIDEVNAAIAQSPRGTHPLLSPAAGNVCFASATYGWCFTLESFARQYAARWQMPDARPLARRLWGDVFYRAQTRSFVRKGVDARAPRSFVHFVLEPLYKLHALVVAEDAPALRPALASLGVRLRDADYALDARRLLRRALGHFFGPPGGLVDVCAQQLPSPAANAAAMAQRLCAPGPVAQAIAQCSADGPLVVAVAKQVAAADGQSFYALGRILSGTVSESQHVRVLGEGFAEDAEDAAAATVDALWVWCARYRVRVSGLGAGALVLLGGVDASMAKTATIVGAEGPAEALLPLRLPTPVVRLAVEPAVPSELPQLLRGLRAIAKTYPQAQTRVEESGEHVLLGPGELYLDCILHDLRHVHASIEVRVADPVVSFRECALETSAVRTFVDSPNRHNRLTLMAEPLDSAVARDIECGLVDARWPARQLGHYMEEAHGWDILAARSIWAFGPGPLGANVLSDDSLPQDTNKQRLRSVRDSVRQGFQWAAREGPLCDEPMRATRFRILDATLADSPIHRGAGQIIPMARRVCYAAFLTAEPRLMEPINRVDIQAPADCVASVYTVIARRRGHVTQDAPRAGSAMYAISALIPTIDAAGFETDLRTYTGGRAFCQHYFETWQVVPGDPLDKSVVLTPLEPARGDALARDFMLKTRRRKGLGDDVSIDKFIDDPALRDIVKSFQ